MHVSVSCALVYSRFVLLFFGHLDISLGPGASEMCRLSKKAKQSTIASACGEYAVQKSAASVVYIA